MCTFLLENNALWDMRPMHWGICATCVLDERIQHKWSRHVKFIASQESSGHVDETDSFLERNVLSFALQ